MNKIITFTWVTEIVQSYARLLESDEEFALQVRNRLNKRKGGFCLRDFLEDEREVIE